MNLSKAKAADHLVACWTVSGAVVLLGLLFSAAQSIPRQAFGSGVAAVAVFFGAYVSVRAWSGAASLGFPCALLLVRFGESLLPVSEFNFKTMELAAYAGVVGLIGSLVANLVSRRGILRAVVEGVEYFLLFAFAFLVGFYLVYFLSTAAVFVPRILYRLVGLLVCCVAGGVAGAMIGMVVLLNERSGKRALEAGR
jgi:hypothetical protein